jgi:heme/copper-type cytochrome/quinol oxidase subunit 2
MEVKVTGYQWFWQMDYGDGVKVLVNPTAAANGTVTYDDTFHLPADVPILLNITGGDVIHAFNIMDANRAYVTMDDANPDGPHKHLRQVHSFPAGKYLIQCKEMCLNPGHGYMRAELIVERQEAFDEWKADRALFGSAGLKEFIDVTAKDGKLTYDDPAPSVVVAGTRVGVKVSNEGRDPVSVVAGGNQTVVQPGQVGRVAFDAVGGQTYEVAIDPGATLEIEAVVPDRTIDLELGDFFIEPPTIRLEAGKGYLFRATNVGGTGHNLFIGAFGGEVLAASNNAGPGELALVYFKPTESGTLDWWCNVPGHHGLGMSGTVTVA